MSSIVISGDTSGAVTLAVPAVAGTNTITVPSVTGTMLTTRSTGGILQVVQGILSGQISTSSTSFVTTGLTSSITPSASTNKVLITVSMADIFTNGSGIAVYGTIYRNSTNIAPSGSGVNQGFAQIYAGSSTVQGNLTFSFLDSPSTTSATTYTVYYASSGGTVLMNQNGQTSTIILQEVVA
jgi:hypothetical protein